MRKRLCFLEIRVFSILLPFLVRLLPFGRVLEAVEPRKPWRGAGLPTPEEVAAFVDRLLRRRVLMRRQLCFRRSLVLYRFLRKLGLGVEINFGVLPPDAGCRLKAHAWLSLNGKPFQEDREAQVGFRLIHSHSGKSRA